jgi:hypothetical protein
LIASSDEPSIRLQLRLGIEAGEKAEVAEPPASVVRGHVSAEVRRMARLFEDHQLLARCLQALEVVPPEA